MSKCNCEDSIELKRLQQLLIDWIAARRGCFINPMNPFKDSMEARINTYAAMNEEALRLASLDENFINAEKKIHQQVADEYRRALDEANKK